MKILLLGSQGQVGTELSRALLPLGEVQAWSRQDADLSDPAALAANLAGVCADVIVNASAYTAVDKAETDSATAFAVNGDAVACLARHATAQGALLVHYSTDYVFDGTKQGSYLPDDVCAPLSVYGKSKRQGEEAILASGCDTLVLRTSWVYSVHGGNFIKTVLRLAAERKELGMVADQWGAPTSAEFIADVTADAILARRGGRLASGIHHLTAAGRTNWCELARYVVARAQAQGLTLRASPERIRAIRTQDYPLPAPRPRNSSLAYGPLADALDLQFPEWPVYVNRVVDQLCRQLVSQS